MSKESKTGKEEKEVKTGKVTFQLGGDEFAYEFQLPSVAEAKKLIPKATVRTLKAVSKSALELSDDEYDIVMKVLKQVRTKYPTGGRRGNLYAALDLKRGELVPKIYTGKARSKRFITAMNSIRSQISDRYVDIEIWKGREITRRVKDKTGKLTEHTTRNRFALVVNLTNSKFAEYMQTESETRRVL